MAGISKWYVIHTYSGYENKVRDNIQKVVENRGMQDRILDVSVPTETVEETKEDGTVKEVERKTFPGYVFVKLSVEEDGGTYTMPDDAWYVIRNTRGVTGFV
ncbi:MAG: transcription termination/antitermination protein NusG, partial [Clostridia bacterium]|nr:transcription termination/antitermination protein NusG [Clostridia bacterium]